MEEAKQAEHTCPHCGGDKFGRPNDVPATTGGWHGGVMLAWGQYAGAHLVKIVARRCEDCGHIVNVDLPWD
jgi:predicted RNA-binding Zn-ribbon protein involved in translation (DUF1610 family)